MKSTFSVAEIQEEIAEKVCQTDIEKSQDSLKGKSTVNCVRLIFC